MEESTNQYKHITKDVRLKSSDTNLVGESRINYYILAKNIPKYIDIKLTLGVSIINATEKTLKILPVEDYEST